ncbi:MAG: hypothetical protein AAB215_09415 [Planctomycetota bacterium]
MTRPAAILFPLLLFAGCAAFQATPNAIYLNDRLITIERLDRLEVPPTLAVTYENRAFSIRGDGRIKINGKLVWVEGESVHVEGSRFDVGRGRSLRIDAYGRVSLDQPAAP